MSDPAQEPDIEDVLASVRRLVTAERRERPATPSALVLTPSQRVERPSVPVGTTEAARRAEEEAPDAESQVEPPSEPAPDPAPEAEPVADAAWEEDEPQDAFESWRRDRLEPGPEAEAPDPAPRLGAVPTIDGTPAARAPAGKDEPAAAPEDAVEAALGSIEAALDAAGAAEEAEPGDGADETDVADAPDGAPRVAFRHDPEPEIAAPGPGSGRPLFEEEADEAPGEDADAYAAFEEVSLEGTTEVDPDAVEDAEILDEPRGAGPSEADVLDEETLRSMVADIVREELRGPLGERITSNVRKLVRREIHRILAARDFE